MRHLPLLLLATAFGPPALAEGDPLPSAGAIDSSVRAGVRWLRAAQRADGSWGPCVAGSIYGTDARVEQFCYPKGPTAFALFTLATCGAKPADGAVQRGLNWLRPSNADTTRYSSYESSAIILMLTALYGGPPPKALPARTPKPRVKPEGSVFPQPDWLWMHDHVENLLACRAGSGGFGYWPGEGSYADASATQFAVLALRAASLAGYPVEAASWDVWLRAAGYVRALQEREGGIPYHRRESWSSGMTAAGLATLALCKEQVDLLGQPVPAWLGETEEKAFAHLEKHFDVAANASAGADSRYHYCHLYAVERFGKLSGRREIAGRDWYLRGAAYLVARQHDDGKWVDRTCMDPEDVLGTCFALLFLKKATPPVVTPAR